MITLSKQRVRRSVSVILALSLLVVGAVNAAVIDNGDGTITDPVSGLMWVKDGNDLPGGWSTWDQAIELADTLTFAGYSDWRLPENGEFDDLYYRVLGGNWGQSAPEIFPDDPPCEGIADPDPFINLESGPMGNYWENVAIGVINRGYFNFNCGTGGLLSRASTILVWPVRDASHTCYPDLPIPELSVTGTEDYIGSDGQEYTRYRLVVSNWSAFPEELFEAAPDLDACGLNTNASRTWINIYREDDTYIYGFCALSDPEQLNDIWFALPRGETPPDFVYITLTDRRCEITYKSNLASTAPLAPQPPVANAGTDQTIIDTDQNGSEQVVLDGSGSTDLDGAIQSYVWREGANQIATGVNPTVTLTLGPHTIMLTVTDNHGTTDTATVIVSVISEPWIRFTGITVATGVGPKACNLEAWAYTDIVWTGCGTPSSGTCEEENTIFLNGTTGVTLEFGDYELSLFRCDDDGWGDHRVYTGGELLIKQGAATVLGLKDSRISLNSNYYDPNYPTVAGSGWATIDMSAGDPGLRNELNPYGTEQVELVFSTMSPLIQDTCGEYAFDLVMRPTTYETNEGANVITQPVDSGTGTQPVTMEFAEVTESGSTELIISDVGPDPPEGFELAGKYYDISTTASYTPPVTVCIQYDDTGMTLVQEEALRLYHYEGGAWVDVTDLPLDTEHNMICGTVNSLSAFAVFMPDLIGFLTDAKTGDKKFDKDIDKAIAHINKSMETDLWLEKIHINDKKVFDEQKKAVKKLMHVINSKKAPDDTKAVCQMVSERLVLAANMLAVTAYEDAVDALNEVTHDKIRDKINKELDKCEDEFAKAQKKIDEPKKHGPDYAKAINHYKHAWEHAQHAL